MEVKLTVREIVVAGEIVHILQQLKIAALHLQLHLCCVIVSDIAISIFH